jgi:predicted Rossmann-fold nucleotide-binding protein
MEAASRGAKSRRGLTIGLLAGARPLGGQRLGRRRDRDGPWGDPQRADRRTSDALVAVGGGVGTLSEIGFALKLGRPVIGVGTFEVEGVVQVSSAAEAAELALR